MSEDFRLALAQERHDHVVCERCAQAFWAGDMVWHWRTGELVCDACAELIDEEQEDADDDE
jgi:hypothetical protein